MNDEVLLNKIAIVERCIKRVRDEYVGYEQELADNHTKQDSILLNLYPRRLDFRQGVKSMSNRSLYIINEDCEWAKTTQYKIQSRRVYNVLVKQL